VPSFEVVTTPLASAEADLAVVGAFSTAERDAPPELAADGRAIAGATGIDLATVLEAAGFDGRIGSWLRVPTRGATSAPSLLVVGLGGREEAGAGQLRRAAAAAAAAAERAERMATTLHAAIGDLAPAVAAQAVVEGIILGAYRFGGYRSRGRAHALEQVTLHVDGDVEVVRSGVEVGRVAADATVLARDLVNTPPQDKRPEQLADRVVAALEGSGIEVTVLDEHALAEGGYGGVLAVGQGSSAPPRLVELSYSPAAVGDTGDVRHVVLVGKGITFDSGGVSLKPSESMESMKKDMAGAASVVGAVRAAAALELPVKITGVIALAENMPSGSATRVSDVVTLKNGTTVEVTNTDAEGRLVLGDALVRAGELEPDAVVDVATLTGAAVVALGERIGALIASDDGLADALLDASARAGEPFWRMPLAKDEYGERLEGDIADLRNAGGRSAGTVFAGLFLERFAPDDTPWAHLDVAGVAWTDEAYGEHTKGGTGVPVRTLIEWLRAG